MACYVMTSVDPHMEILCTIDHEENHCVAQVYIWPAYKIQGHIRLVTCS